MWSILESKACATSQASLDSLKSALEKAWDEITIEQCASIVDDFPNGLKVCFSAQGGHFENLLL